MARQNGVTLGTLSFARCGPIMLLRPSERRRLILAASDAYQPDLLVTAGYGLHDRRQLHQLAAALAEDPRPGTIITEVHHDGRAKKSIGQSHAMWAIDGDGELHRFGRQAFATSREAARDGGCRVVKLRRKLTQRGWDTDVGRVFALVCGELNVVRGREQPRFIDPDIESAVMQAEIVANPTHDRMSNAGTLDAKRRLLSRPHADGRSRVYVSCSNWEACGLNGRVQQPSPTLHTVYVDGEPQAYEELADGAFGFVYRRWRLQRGGGT